MEIYVNLKDVVEHLRNSPLIPQNAKGAVVLDAEAIPASDVVSKADYDELLKAARAMHTWIFLHSFDELEAYDECKLTPEMNALLGYGGRLEIRSKGDG